MKEPKDISILVVDDEASLRKALVYDFKRRGFNVFQAASGNEAFELVKKHEIHLVLSDVRMPNGDGVELLEKIKAKDAELPVVMFITGFADLTLEDAYDKGADAVFTKPFDRKELFSVVMKAVNSKEAIWGGRKAERYDTNLDIELTFPQLSLAVEGKMLNIGRGGMFVALKHALPVVLSNVTFQILFRKGLPKQIEGNGIVRWVRTVPTELHPTGCGIEFEHLSEESRKQVIEFIASLKPKAFIPKK